MFEIASLSIYAPVVVWLEGASLVEPHVFGLLVRQFGEVSVECW